MTETFHVDPDIRRASTPPGAVYGDPGLHERIVSRVFAHTWQWVEPDPASLGAGEAAPFTLLDGSLDEPLLLTRDPAGDVRCLSNVCTHRGSLLVERRTPCRTLRCRYHGRRFELDGRMRTAPEFDGAENFPRDADDLPRLELARWGPCRFTSLAPVHTFDDWIEPVRARVDGLYPGELTFDPNRSRDFSIDVNWALYCDNYLEGFHIPYVHPELATTLDHAQYSTELFELGSLQLGIASPGELAFELPAEHPDRDRAVAAYYFWLYPNTMLNFYPWGLSVNLVEPRGPRAMRVRFLQYLADPGLRDRGAGADLDTVETQDQEVVRACQRGVRSRLYDRGRYAPAREQAVHHFHRLLSEALTPSASPSPSAGARRG